MLIRKLLIKSLSSSIGLTAQRFPGFKTAIRNQLLFWGKYAKMLA